MYVNDAAKVVFMVGIFEFETVSKIFIVEEEDVVR